MKAALVKYLLMQQVDAKVNILLLETVKLIMKEVGGRAIMM